VCVRLELLFWLMNIRVVDCICISTVRWERNDFTLVLISAPLTWNLGLARSSIFGVGLSNLVSSL
jgi:hypothetical protein